MNIIIRVAVMACLFLADVIVAKEDISLSGQIPQLKEETPQETVSQRVTSRLTCSHYRQFNLDNAFAAKIIARYFSMLDYNHYVFLASDIDKYANYKSQLVNELKSGKLDLPFNIYNLAQQRRLERYKYALVQLQKPMDFSSNDTIELNRSKAPWPKNIQELNRLWDSKVKHDELNLKLDGKEDETIREILTKRYQLSVKRLTQGNSEDVFQLVMNSFTHEIDPHTNYLSPHNTEQFNTDMSLSLEGIGAILQMDDDYIIINALLPGGPAAKTKSITVGDRIVGIGQTGKPMVDVIGWRLDDVVSLIKGPKGSKVRLEVLPANKNTKTHIVTFTREHIRLQDRAVKMTVKNIGTQTVAVLNIAGFYLGLTDDVKLQLQKLEKQHVQSIIIDLRSNGGGALAEAVSLSGLFIPSGPIVQVRNNNGKIREDSDIDGVVYYSGPLVILVDRFSASAAEIFTAAMQDYGRALIVGEPTFGKGTVQQHRSLNRIYDQILRPQWPVMGSIQYTIQKFYRINGGSTQCKGVVPDIIMPTGNDTIETGEKFEDNALPWDSIRAVTYNKIGDIKPYVSKLLQAHQERIAKDPEFKYIAQDIIRFHAMKKKRDVVSLNLAQRKKENYEDNIFRLKRSNERLLRQGKKPVKTLEAIPKDFKDPDPYLDESGNIAIDLATVISQQLNAIRDK